MDEVLLFVNPIAGRGRTRKMAERIVAKLHADGLSVRTFAIPANQIPDSELCPAKAAITIGGDGTLRAAAERLLEFARDDASQVPPLLVIPLGTANLMAQHLGLAWDDDRLESQVSGAIAARRVSMLDAARANGRLCLLMVGIGLDAAIVHELNRVRRGPIGYASYAIPLFTSLRDYDYPPLHVEVDGKCVADGVPALAFAGNIAEYGTGFPILTEARPNDSMLDICVLPCRSAEEVLRWMMLVATGDHVHAEGVVYVKGRSIRVTSPRPVPVQIDGDASGHTPLQIELLPSRMPFIVN